MVSLPAPPVIVSAPSPVFIVSLPSFASTISSPLPRVIVSANCPEVTLFVYLVFVASIVIVASDSALASKPNEPLCV